jgi:hypothetical protein
MIEGSKRTDSIVERILLSPEHFAPTISICTSEVDQRVSVEENPRCVG